MRISPSKKNLPTVEQTRKQKEKIKGRRQTEHKISIRKKRRKARALNLDPGIYGISAENVGNP